MILDVKNTIQKYSLIKSKDRVLCAVSGGPDSVAMLYLLCELRKEFNFNIGVVYFHHGIRDESDFELEFVKNLSSKFKLSFFTKRSDIPKIAVSQKRSLEETARIERYGFFIELAKKEGFRKIAVAHNRDDQAETFLHRLLRGSGLRGLASIAPISEMNGLVIIRPLIECSREKIESYLKKMRISSCIDESNKELRFTRNKIRHQLLPYLEKEFNPNTKEVLYNTVENIQTVNNFLDREIGLSFKRCVKKEQSYVMINTERFKKMHPFLQSEIIRKAIEHVKGDLKRFEYSHWKEVEDLVYKRPHESIVDLPHGLCIKKIKGSLIVGRQNKNGFKK